MPGEEALVIPLLMTSNYQGPCTWHQDTRGTDLKIRFAERCSNRNSYTILGWAFIILPFFPPAVCLTLNYPSVSVSWIPGSYGSNVLSSLLLEKYSRHSFNTQNPSVIVQNQCVQGFPMAASTLTLPGRAKTQLQSTSVEWRRSQVQPRCFLKMDLSSGKRRLTGSSDSKLFFFFISSRENRKRKKRDIRGVRKRKILKKVKSRKS